MTQKRFWNFEDDDLTTSFNNWLLGALKPGKYAGFDFQPTANMNLTLNHLTTGIIHSDNQDPPQALASQGLILTKQGVAIKEDAAIVIPISPGSANPRIDLIVVNHKYQQITGGSAATYSVIQGIANPSPVVPGLALPNEQTIVGQLYVPASITQLDDPSVEWTSNPPDIGADAELRELLESEILSRIAGDSSLQSQVDLKADIAFVTDWTNLPYGASGADSTLANFRRAQYAKDSFGFVHFRGFLNCTGAGGQFGVLPVDHRPPGLSTELHRFPVFGTDLNLFSNLDTYFISIAPTGTMNIINAGPNTLWLDGLSFYAGF